MNKYKIKKLRKECFALLRPYEWHIMFRHETGYQKAMDLVESALLELLHKGAPPFTIDPVTGYSVYEYARVYNMERVSYKIAGVNDPALKPGVSTGT